MPPLAAGRTSTNDVWMPPPRHPDERIFGYPLQALHLTLSAPSFAASILLSPTSPFEILRGDLVAAGQCGPGGAAAVVLAPAVARSLLCDGVDDGVAGAEFGRLDHQPELVAETHL